jgi:hypothetical protein
LICDVLTAVAAGLVGAVGGCVSWGCGVVALAIAE